MKVVMVLAPRRGQSRGGEEERNEGSLEDIHLVVMSWMGISVKGYTEIGSCLKRMCKWRLLWWKPAWVLKILYGRWGCLTMSVGLR